MRRLYGVAIVVAIGVAIAALVSGLIILEGWDAISEESGVAIKQKQHAEKFLRRTFPLPIFDKWRDKTQIKQDCKQEVQKQRTV